MTCEVSVRSQAVNQINESGVQAQGDQGQGDSYKFGSHPHTSSNMVF